MKKSAIALAILSNIACAQSVKVTGCGNSFDSAKDDAFKNAVELQVGSVLVNHAETKNGELIRNEIIKYSSGYIDRFVVIDYTKVDTKDCVHVEAWVSTNKIADRILGVNTSPKSFDGQNLGARYDTWMDAKKNGDKLLTSVLKDYPKKAFIVKQEKTKMGVDNYRRPFLDIEYEFTWNSNYIESLRDTLTLLADGNDNYLAKNPSQITILSQRSKDKGFFESFGTKYKFPFSNLNTTIAIKDWFTSNQPAIELKIYNQANNLIHLDCYTPAKFTMRTPSTFWIAHDNQSTINGAEVESGYIRLDQELQFLPVQNIQKIELSIAGPECWGKRKKTGV